MAKKHMKLCSVSPIAVVCLVTNERTLCPTLCDPMDCSTPGFPVLHHLLEYAQTHVHWVGDDIQPSHPDILFSCLQSFPASASFPMSRQITLQWNITSHQSELPSSRNLQTTNAREGVDKRESSYSAAGNVN